VKNHSYIVFWNEGDRGYIATCLEFLEQSAFGETPEEALAELKIALQSAVEVCEAEGISAVRVASFTGYCVH
jgi:predicted RNase H-like HicB family nuclease